MRKKITEYIIIGITAAIALTTGILYTRQEVLQQSLSEKILRFHVLANSDREEDQALKLKVRDAVGIYMQQELEGVTDLSECKTIIESNLLEIKKVAVDTIRTEGYDYQVEVALEDTNFPEKTYGTYTFPAGSYEALRVTIGEGEGHNWWCVLYPNMCFENCMYEVIDENAKEALQEVLTEEEYEEILESGNYQIRFKYLTFLNEYLKEP